jgi:uncharacterized coiled-coil protein SlyX
MTKLFQITETKEAIYQQFNCMKDAEIKRLRALVGSQSRMIDALNSELDEKQDELDELKATLAKMQDVEAV